MKNIIIWGVGERLKRYMDRKYFSNCNILALVDTNKVNEICYGFIVLTPERILDRIEICDFVVITTKYYKDIYNKCLNMKILRKKIILTDYIDVDFLYDFDSIRLISEKLYQEMVLNHYRLIKVNENDEFDTKRKVGTVPFSDSEYLTDYFRYRTFEFVAEAIIDNEVSGELAEFGVFRGLFSALIMDKLPNRKMYWFDTFEGFSNDEIVKEKALGRCPDGFAHSHTLTSVDLALSNVNHPENCVICKGIFPASISEEAVTQTYAFVSIDVDFEDSTYEGLKFFYPRLNEGGYIFLHDYHSAFLGGVKMAVERYQHDFNVRLKIVPLADRAGTLVIIK
jgi:hypothetical protein